jgi:hypothetical protein
MRRCVLPTLMLAVLLHAAPAWAASFTLESLYDQATGRLTVAVDIVGVNDVLPGSFGVIGFDFNLAFNPLLLSGDPATDITVLAGNFLDPTMSFVSGGFDSFFGAVSVFGTLLGPVPTGTLVDGRLATITLLNVVPGINPGLLVSSVNLARLIDPSPGAVVPVDVVSVTTQTAVVPEPSTLAFLLLGALALRRGRQRRAGPR